MRITVKAFRGWLESLAPNKRVGTEATCPIETYLVQELGVDSHEVNINMKGLVLPTTLSRFLPAVDDYLPKNTFGQVSRYDWRAITASKALRALDRAERRVRSEAAKGDCIYF